jgi:hypothetical protein
VEQRHCARCGVKEPLRLAAARRSTSPLRGEETGGLCVSSPLCGEGDRRASLRGGGGALGREFALGRSAAEAAFVEEGLLLGRGGAAQGGVAVGEAAETDDDVAVEPAPFLQLGVAGDQGHVAVLVLDPF